MDLYEKIANLPAQPGVYLFQDAAGTTIYVGKARSLRHRVKSYFLESRRRDAKTGSLVREIADLQSIVVDNEKEALALENNLIKQHKPKFNVLLRDDKTYPYICYTAFEKFPRVFVTRRLKQDGSLYFGPYFPARLAHRIVHFIHRYFGLPAGHADRTQPHARAWLEFYLDRCLGPRSRGSSIEERYAEAAHDARLLLEGRLHDLSKRLEARMQQAAEEERFEAAASYRNLRRTLLEMEERQKMSAAAGDDTDVLAWYAEPPQVAVNLFHARGGRVVDRRDFYWEDLEEFDAQEFLPSLLKQIYLDSTYLPRFLYVPIDFDERQLLEEALGESSGHRVEILVPQRGSKRALLELVEKNARHCWNQRFRARRPSPEAIGEALETTLGLDEPPRRIECFDVSHLQGSDTVASMVVWENGRMKKSDYRKFIIRGGSVLPTDGPGVVLLRDDFASLREAVERRYRRLLAEERTLPSLILIDGGVGQLHAAAEALEKLGIPDPPLASIAKKEEILYVLGREAEPVVLDRHSPVLHLIQQIRDETHRFGVTFHRQRRARAQIRTSLVEIPGVGPQTARELLERFGSVAQLRRLSLAELSTVISPRQARRVFEFLQRPPACASSKGGATSSQADEAT